MVNKINTGSCATNRGIRTPCPLCETRLGRNHFLIHFSIINTVIKFCEIIFIGNEVVKVKVIGAAFFKAQVEKNLYFNLASI